MDYTKMAIEKIAAAEDKSIKFSQKAEAVRGEVVRVLKMFCEQNNEFAQAVVQSNKNIKDCIEHTVDGCDNCISDIEVYSRATAFWFDGATVDFTMSINLGDGGFSNGEEPPKKHKRLEISFDDIMF